MIRRFITRNQRLLLLFLCTMPMLAQAAYLTIYDYGGGGMKLNVVIDVTGDCDQIIYSIDYEDDLYADVTNAIYSETVQGYGYRMGFEMECSPATVTAIAMWNGQETGSAVAKYYGFAEESIITTYPTSIQAPNIIPALPSGATIKYANATTTTAPKNTIGETTGVISISDIGQDLFCAYVQFSASAGAGPDIQVLNGSTQNGYYIGPFSLTVSKKTLTEGMISLSPASITYDGSTHTPWVEVKDGIYSFNKDYDYTVSHASDIKDKGDYPVTITATANGKLSGGPFTKTFSIIARSINDAKVTLGYTTAQYTGSELKPSVSVALPSPKGGYDPPLDASNYKVTYENATNVGTATVTVKGKGNYTGSASATFTITARSLGDATFGTISEQIYTGSAITPEPTVTWIPATGGPGTQLVKGTDFDFSYTNNVNVPATPNAPPTITITGKGNYTGSKSKTFTIVKATPVVTAPTAKSLTYNGAAQALVNAGSTTLGTLQYSLDDRTYGTNVPTSTGVGSYTVYYRVVGDGNINDVAAQSITVTISKAAGSLSYAATSISKTFGNAAFTNPLTLTGDGTVRYSTSNASVASVNATTGEVTIAGSGSATITATVTDGTNYTYATKTASYTITVGTNVMNVTATGYTGTYDGQSHGITVTAPDGATVKYGTTAGSYTLTASPTYTAAGSYTVYYQVSKANYTTVTGSQTVVISKAAGSLSYATTSLSKTFGNAAFTNPLTMTGDGTVKYSSSNASVASVNATTGEVTIAGSGSATITATVTDGTNYTYATKTASYTITVGTNVMNVTATGYTGTYDGQAHGITVTAPDGATVKYGETAGNYNLSASPTYINVGTYTVYYQVTKTGYTTVTGSAVVTISKAQATVRYDLYEFTAKIGEPFNRPYVTLDPQGLKLSYWSSDNDVAIVDAQTGEVTLIAPGRVNIYAEFAGDENYNRASDYYILTVLQRDIEPIDEDVTIVWKDEDFIITDADGKPVEKKLKNTVIYDILFSLDITGDPSESDGYDETADCVVLNYPMSNRDVDNIIFRQLEPGTEAYADEYTGLTFKVPAGKGYVIIDSKTDGEYQMMVKIGNLSPIAFNHTDREKDSVFYECSSPTWVYVYNGGKVSNARMDANHRAKKQKGHVMIYSITRSSSVGDGIERINMDAFEESDRWYDLQGNRINRPTKKGIYILRGQKVIVK